MVAPTGDTHLDRVVHAFVKADHGSPCVHGAVPSVLKTLTFVEQTPVALVVVDVIRWLRADRG